METYESGNLLSEYRNDVDKFIGSFMAENYDPEDHYGSDDRVNIPFSKSEITACFYLGELSDECPHCGNGETAYYVIQVNKELNYLIGLWCGCSSYDETYIIESSGTMVEVLSSFIKETSRPVDQSMTNQILSLKC